MAKSFFETISTVGGLAGEYESLTEVEIAAAPGASYTPPETSQVFRAVAARTIQLMGGAPIYIESFQTSAYTLRVPKGSDGTAGNENDAQDGRLFFIRSGDTAVGLLTLETSDGLSTLGTISSGQAAIVLHGDNDSWDVISLNDSQLLAFRYGHTSGVPGAGTRYLQAGDVATSSAGDQIAPATVLLGVSLRVNVVDASRSFDLEILTNPSGTPAVIATVTLPPNTISVNNFALLAAINADTELGARIVRATGSGSSTFGNVLVNVYLGTS